MADEEAVFSATEDGEDGGGGGGGGGGDDAPNMEQKLINEEYKIWKKNAPYLYDTVLTHALEWPSLTVQWMPDRAAVPDTDEVVQRLLLGTHTSDNEPNHIMLAELRLPSPDADLDLRDAGGGGTDEARGGFGFGGTAGKLEIVQKINHKGEVNRARYCPQNANLIATKTAGTEVLVFDRTKHPSKPQKDGHCSPDLRLRGHKKEGYGLSWSPHVEGLLLSGSDDKLVNTWDISCAAKAPLDPLQTYVGHTDVVEDVAWHMHHKHIFASCGDDKMVLFWDTRCRGEPTQRLEAHTGEVNCIDFNAFSEFLFASGSADRTVALWDARNLRVRLHSLHSHMEQIFSVHWAPFDEAVLASCSADRRVNVWDLSRIGEAQAPEDAEDGPPELLFVHGGHTDKISDFDFNARQEWMMASVADNNVLQVWQPAENIYASEDAFGDAVAST